MAAQTVVMLVEPNEAIRDALFQAIRAEKIVSKMATPNSLEQAASELRKSNKIDIIFLSNTFSHEAVLHFTSIAKNSDASRDAALILLVSHAQQTSNNIAKQVLSGMDGFLSYPFNIEAVQSTIKIAAGVRAQRMIERVALASSILLTDLSKQIDAASHEVGVAGDDVALLSSVEESARILSTFKESELPVYFEVLSKALQKAKPAVKFSDAQSQAPARGAGTPKRIFDRLSSSSPFVRSLALREIEQRAEELKPYLDEMKRRLDKIDLQSKARLEAVIAQLQSR